MGDDDRKRKRDDDDQEGDQDRKRRKEAEEVSSGSDDSSSGGYGSGSSSTSSETLRRRKQKKKDKKKKAKKKDKKKKDKKKKDKKKKKKKSKGGKKEDEEEEKATSKYSWGKYGILHEHSLNEKMEELHAWMREVKKVDYDNLTKPEVKQYFSEFKEDYNLGILHERYVNLTVWEAKHGKKDLDNDEEKRERAAMVGFNDAELLRREQAELRARAKMTEKDKKTYAEMQRLKNGQPKLEDLDF